MSRFIKVQNSPVSSVIVNLDKVLFATETQGGIFLTLAIKESGQHDGLMLPMSMDEFLTIANDKG